MEKIALQWPEERHEQQASLLKEEFFAHGEPVINGSALLDQMEFGPWLTHVIRSRRPETAPGDWVPSDTFFAVRASDEKIVGVIDIRHNLNHPFLAAYGGHIGFAVRPSERQKGYATQMLRLALIHARALSLKRVMLGCYACNTASAKTIARCGGICTETKPYSDGQPMRLYWIDLTGHSL